ASVSALAGALALAFAGSGCKSEPDPEPRFGATCVPDGSMEKVTCTVKNHGTKASRACLRVRIQPPSEVGPEIITRRVCTGVLGRGRSAEVTPLFERLGRITPAQLLSSQCLDAGQWQCKLEVVETSREMAENLPKEP